MARQILALCALMLVSVATANGQDLRDAVKTAQESANQSANAFAELRTEVQKLVAAKEYEQAIAKIDEALAKDPENFPANSLRQLVAIQASGSQPKLAVEQITKQFEFVLARIEHPMSNVLPSILGAASRIGSLAGEADLAERFADKTLETIRSKLKVGEPSSMHTLQADIIAIKARQLQAMNEAGKAKQLIADELASAEAMVAKHASNPDAIRYLVAAFRNQIMNSDNPATDFERFELFAAGRLKDNPGDMDVLLGYLQTANGYIGFIARREPDVAAAVLDRAKTVLNTGREANKGFEQVAQSMEQMLKRHDAVIASSRKLLELVGQPAPPMDAMQWANGGPIDTESLKGKVVLLDFWAVWCGPCIMTFPHLIHWQEEFGPKGFQVIGVTRQYGYAWDATANKAAKASEEVSLEDELEMLNKFMASHDLKHPTMVTPMESMMNSNYGVSGIPHAVLIDKAGKVRMVRVGSGDQNAKDLQEMIEKLLAES